eukprot:2917481-Pleurochrysis_carterae.AAC.2
MQRANISPRGVFGAHVQSNSQTYVRRLQFESGQGTRPGATQRWSRVRVSTDSRLTECEYARECVTSMTTLSEKGYSVVTATVAPPPMFVGSVARTCAQRAHIVLYRKTRARQQKKII